MSILIFLHTLGGHYTFAQVPFEWVTDLFGFERNHFDRVAHFSVGLYAFASRIMNFPVTLISTALRPVIFQEMASNGIKSQETKINLILNWLAIITVPFVVFYFYYADCI